MVVPKKKKSCVRFDVSKLVSDTKANREATPKIRYQEAVTNRAKDSWGSDKSVEEKWSALSSAMVEAAKSELGMDRRRHPDWFRENHEHLEPLFRKRNQLYSKWLSTGREQDRKSFADARRRARQATRAGWFQHKLKVHPRHSERKTRAHPHQISHCKG